MTDALIMFAGVVAVVGVVALLDWLGQRAETRKPLRFRP
jgi:hypothetical protein